jgi:hypothetical protein
MWLNSMIVGRPSRSFQRVRTDDSSFSPTRRKTTFSALPACSIDSTFASLIGNGRSAMISPGFRWSSGLRSPIARLMSPSTSA